MHKQAYDCINNYVEKYLQHLNGTKAKVLDIGSLNVNGSLKPIFNNKKWDYVGIDIEKGPNVDVVLKDPYKYPFEDNTFDVAVSTSCFEHNEMFWLSFKEIVRVLKDGAYFFLTAPYKDAPHWKIDCYRFLPDGYRALCKWEPQAQCIDAWISPRPARDCVGAFIIKK